MRGSPRIIARELIGCTTTDVYNILKDMGYIAKDTIGWKLTELGRSNGGRMSQSNYPSPTFDIGKVIDQMMAFCNK